MDCRRKIFALVLLLLCVASSHAQPPSFVDLARHTEYRDVKISPDGQYLAATAVIKGKTALALIHINDKKGLVVQPRDGDDVVDFWWASPKRVIYTVGTRVGTLDLPLSTGELFGVNADGGSSQLLYGYRSEGSQHLNMVKSVTARGTAEFIASIPNDPNYALVSVSSWDAAGREGALPVAYRMDVRDGSLSKVINAPGRDMNFVADHHGHIRFAYGEDVTGSAKIYQHPIEGDGWQLLQKPSADRSFPQTFSRDDSLAYFTCSDTHTGFGICSWDPKTQALQTIWSNPKVGPNGLLLGTAEDDVIGISFEDGRAGASFFDGSSRDAQSLIALMKQFPGESVRFVFRL